MHAKASDIKYNKTKCIRIWLAPIKSNPRKPLGFKWSSDIIEILRYAYGHKRIQTRDQNGEKVRKKTESIITNGDIYNYHSKERKYL